MSRVNATVKNSSSGFVGDVKDFFATSTPTGWIVCSGRTIGSATSGATELASASAENLFIHLWNNSTNTELPVSGGRGASAAADWAANKTIQLPDLRGRVTVGKDDMGGTAANRMTVSGAGVNGTTIGATGGAETHTLSTGQMPSHQHEQASGQVTPTVFGLGVTSGTRGNYGAIGVGVRDLTSAQGSGSAHNNTQPSLVVIKMIKL